MAVCDGSIDESLVPITFDNGREMMCKLDTGADVSLIPRTVLTPELCSDIKPSSATLKAFNKTNIKVDGQIKLQCTHNGSSKLVKFVVVPHDAIHILNA